MERAWIFIAGILVLSFILTGCTHGISVPKMTGKEPAPDGVAKHLNPGILALAKKLVDSCERQHLDRVDVLSLVGPGDDVTALGAHISDKLTMRLFDLRAFSSILERRQLGLLIEEQKAERV